MIACDIVCLPHSMPVSPAYVCLQGRSVQQNERRIRDRSRERNSRRSSSPESPPSPPLPDITVPFYMLPRPDEPELSIPPMASRPQLVSYPTPHLTNASRVPLISYPTPQTAPHSTMDNSVARPTGPPPPHPDTGGFSDGQPQYPHQPPTAASQLSYVHLFLHHPSASVVV